MKPITVAKPEIRISKSINIKQTESEISEKITTVSVKNPTLISNINWKKNSKTHMDSYSQFKTNSINPFLYKYFIIFTIIAFVIYVASKFLSIIKKKLNSII